MDTYLKVCHHMWIPTSGFYAATSGVICCRMTCITRNRRSEHLLPKAQVAFYIRREGLMSCTRCRREVV
jgi:hypothetical protein